MHEASLLIDHKIALGRSSGTIRLGSAERQLGTVEIKNAELALGDPGETHVPRHHDL